MYNRRPMTRLELHDLKTDKRAGDLACLVGGLAANQHRVVVWVADEGRRQIFDDWLWTFERLAFIPHCVWQPTLGVVEDPVVLVGETGNPNRATVLVVGDELPPEEWAREFDVIYDFIPPGEAGKKRREWWERWRDSESND